MEYVDNLIEHLQGLCARSPSHPRTPLTHLHVLHNDDALVIETTASSVPEPVPHSTFSSANSLQSWTDHAEETFMNQKHRVADAEKFYREQLEQRQQIAEDIGKFKREQAHLPSHLKLTDQKFKNLLAQRLSLFKIKDHVVQTARNDLEALKTEQASRAGIAVFRTGSRSERTTRLLKHVADVKQDTSPTRSDSSTSACATVTRSLSPTPRKISKRIDVLCPTRASSA